MKISNKFFQNLESVWSLTREIDPHGSFLGQAVFSRVDADTILYQETGELTLAEGQIRRRCHCGLF